MPHSSTVYILIGILISKTMEGSYFRCRGNLILFSNFLFRSSYGDIITFSAQGVSPV